MEAGNDLTRSECNRLEQAIIEAGRHLKERAGLIATVAGTRPGDENPHTNLDLEVDEILHDLLYRAWTRNQIPVWLSEEKPVPARRLSSEFVLIVDPIDGTRNVLRGSSQAVISVALWQRGRGVIWGCVVNPFTDEIFSACIGQGSFLNGNPLQVTDVSDTEHALFLVSIHESVKGMLDRVKADFKFKPVGSIAYKICLVAAGRGDATFTVNPRHNWDIAAAALIVTEAGGLVTDSLGNVADMNGPELELDGVTATNGHLHEKMLQICDFARKNLKMK